MIYLFFAINCWTTHEHKQMVWGEGFTESNLLAVGAIFVSLKLIPLYRMLIGPYMLSPFYYHPV